MPEPHFAIPDLGFNFYAFFLCIAVLAGEIYVFRALKSVPKLGRIFFAALIMLFTLSAILFTVLFLPEGLFSASLCGGGAFMLCALLFDLFYNNSKIYKFLDLRKPAKTPRFYFCQKCLIAAPLIYSIAKLGCTYAGCCHGFAYSGPFSLTYHKTEVHGQFFPIQPLETLVFLVIFALAHKSQKPLVAILACLSAKFFLDFLRYGHDQMLISPNQIACLILIVSLSIGYLLYQKNILLHKQPK